MIFSEKYNYLNGTHCWFCDREFGKDRTKTHGISNILIRTKEHIIPKSIIKYGDVRNYIASCSDCNGLKANCNAKQFAIKLRGLMKQGKGFNNMCSLFPLMINRAWKLYNKTSSFHNKFKNIPKPLFRSKGNLSTFKLMNKETAEHLKHLVNGSNYFR